MSIARSMFLDIKKMNLLKYTNKFKNYEINKRKCILLSNHQRNNCSTFVASTDKKEFEYNIDGISFIIKDNTNLYKEETKNIPIVLIHGCYGSKKNFNYFSRLLKSNKIVIIDLPNHGNSKHTDTMRYENVEKSIKNVLEKLYLKKCCLAGFSLGGKFSMYCALKNSSLFSRLVIMDILPLNYCLEEVKVNRPFNIKEMTKTLHAIKKKNPRTKKEFLGYLKEKIPDISYSFSQFLCMSLTENKEKNELTWKFNVDTIHNELDHIMNFPLNSDNYKYYNPCSFIIAKESDLAFRVPGYENIISNYFPNAKQFVLENSSHTVYLDEAQETANIINDILDSN